VAQSNNESLWLTIPEYTAAAEIEFLLTRAICQQCRSDSLDPIHALRNRQGDVRLTIVLDEAQRIRHFDLLKRIVYEAELIPDLRILLVAVDDPEFRQALARVGVPLLSMPGLSTGELANLVQLERFATCSLSDAYLQLLKTRTHGHVGLIRAELIRVVTEGNAAKSKARLVAADYSAGAIQNALIAGFLASLSPEEHKLLPPIAVCLSNVTRSRAEALAEKLTTGLGQLMSQQWHSLVVRRLEEIAANEYRVPSLYCGELARTPTYSNEALHVAAGEVLTTKTGGGVSAADFCDAVFHFKAAGRDADAIQCARFLLIGGLVRRDAGLVNYVRSRVLDLIKSIQYHDEVIESLLSFWTIYSLMGLRGIIEIDSETAQQLDNLIEHGERSSAAGADAIDAAKRIHFSMASSLGDTTTAYRLSNLFFDESVDGAPGNIAVGLVQQALVESSTFDVNAFRSWLQAIPQSATWGDETDEGFRVWNTTLSITTRRHVSGSMAEFISDLRETANYCEGESHPALAGILRCVVVRLEIDELRDFDAALKTSQSIVASSIRTDHPLYSIALHHAADAFRCLRQWADAESIYKQAIDGLDVNDDPLLYDSRLSLSVCVARLGRPLEAGQFLTETVELAENDDGLTVRNDINRRLLVEAALLYFNADKPHRAARLLYRCYDLLGPQDHRKTFWANVAVLARMFAGDAPSDAPRPEPGFTIGMQDEDPLAEAMEPVATPFSLATLAAKLGSPHRAAMYFDHADKLTPDSLKIPAINLVKVIPLVEAEQFTAAVVALVEYFDHIDIDCPQQLRAGRQATESYLLQRLLSGITGPNAISTKREPIHEAIEAVVEMSPKSAASQALLQALRALLGRIDGQQDSFDSAYNAAIEAGVFQFAEELPRYWLIWRGKADRLDLQEILIWQLRYLVVIEQTSIAADYIDERIQWLDVFWSRLQIADDDGEIAILRSSITDRRGSSLTRLGRVAEIAAKMINTKILVGLVASISSLPRDSSITQICRQSLIPKILSLHLPVQLDDVATACKETAETLAVASNLSEFVAPTIKELINLTRIVEKRVVDISDVRVILPLMEDISDIFPSCAADILSKCFVIGINSEDRVLQTQVVDRLLRTDCKTLCENRSVVRSTQQMLLATILIAKQLSIVRNLRESCVHLKSNLVGPFQTREQQRQQFDASLAAMRAFCVELDSLIGSRRNNPKSVGVVLAAMDGKAKTLLQSSAAIKIVEQYQDIARELVRTAADALNDRLHYAVKNAPEQVLPVASELIAILRSLNDGEGETALRATLLTLSDISEDVVHKLAPADHVMAIMKNVEDAEHESWESITDLPDVADLTESIMRQFNVPEDRRLNVAAEALSIVQMHSEQRLFCRHIAVTMDLSDRKDPNRAWTSPSDFKGYCQLKKIETNLSSEDALAVMDGLKRTACVGCSDRSPIAASL